MKIIHFDLFASFSNLGLSASVSYAQNSCIFLSKNALINTLNVHPGTKNNKAGYG